MKGEFKKRMAKTVHNGNVSLLEIFAIVDEARKKFPAWYKLGDRVYRYQELTIEQRKKAVLMVTGNEKELLEWFEEWFLEE